jgi:predicted ABC-class ATPase
MAGRWRGRGGGRHEGFNADPAHHWAPGGDLAATVAGVDGRPYPAYRTLAGPAWALAGGWTLTIDRVQADPYAPPSALSVALAAPGFPADLLASRVRRTALADHALRRLVDALEVANGASGGGPGRHASGFGVDAPGQHVLERTALAVDVAGTVHVRLTYALPARGRTCLGREAAAALASALPAALVAAVPWASMHEAAARAHVACVEDQTCLRAALDAAGLVAFVGDGARLPRATGADDRPLQGAAVVPFKAPPSLSITLNCPHAGRVTGMGVRAGVTIIAGGAYHGKSTLLAALAAGVYDKVPGDGRERVATVASAALLRAEDGRRITGVDVSSLLRTLPGMRSTTAFTTDDASGATSQAAGVVEAVECGARVLLLDEDRAANNGLSRDAAMRALVPDDEEPVVPIVARARELAAGGVSLVVAAGACGDLLRVSDAVVRMRDFKAFDATADAVAAVAAAGAAPPAALVPAPSLLAPRPRPVLSLHPHATGDRDGRDLRAKATGPASVSLGETAVDLTALGQLADPSQTRAIAAALVTASIAVAGAPGGRTVAQLAAWLDGEVERGGLDALAVHARPPRPGALARPRVMELAAAINRVRTLRVAEE